MVAWPRRPTFAGHRSAPPGGGGRCWFSAITLSFLLLFLSGTGLPAAEFTPADLAAAKTVFQAIDGGKWKKARDRATASNQPLLVKIVRWTDYRRPDSGAPFEDIARFIDDNPDWPDQSLLRRRAEEAMGLALAPDRALAWFDKHPPVSIDGRIRHAAALLATGRAAEGRAAIRAAWIEGDFGKSQEAGFYRSYRKLLTLDDHRRRLERLIWDDRYWPAKRLLRRIPVSEHPLAMARLMLMQREPGVDGAIARVPKDLRDHPGLIYERLRWRRRKGFYLSARELLDPPPADPVRPDKWWTERHILARHALDEGHVSEAYRLAAGHGLEPEGTMVADYAEAEWLAGWIALRFLDDRQIALNHFVAMFQAVGYPISRARGAYWSGRAAEDLGLSGLAELWYRVAARFGTTFYGQLAAERLSLEAPPPASPALEMAPGEKAYFDGHEMARAIRLLALIGKNEQTAPFVFALAKVAPDSAVWHERTAALAAKMGRRDLAIRLAKEASYDGTLLTEAGYPVIDLPPVMAKTDIHVPEPALVLAMIRQESAFWPQARSSAGALGLMQIVPATARRMAKNLKLDFARERLVEEPAFNLRLGQAYLAHLLDGFDDSYVLALAAYNAGPTRAREWIRMHGDPRNTTVDVVDWIESLPFAETRNYIQRVLESLQVYRRQLADKETRPSLAQDLTR